MNSLKWYKSGISFSRKVNLIEVAQGSEKGQRWGGEGGVKSNTFNERVTYIAV
jgi:hypothetical protein